MNAMCKKRLLKLADALMKIKSGWDFDRWVNVPQGARPIEEIAKEVLAGSKKMTCGTTACAIGWCPAVFPRSWEWGQEFVRLKGTDGGHIASAAIFFGLTYPQVEFLFVPGVGHSDRLSSAATPQQVAKRIKKFVEKGEMW